MTPSSIPGARSFVTMLVWLNPEGSAALAQFRKAAAPLFAKYDLHIERVLACTGKGELVGKNPHELPDLIQVLSFPSLEAFRGYTADAEYVRLAALRDTGIRRMTAVIGQPLDVSALSPTSASTPSQRLYGAAFVRFETGGAEGLAEFNRRAVTLFARHGMHVESMSEVVKVATPLGEPLVEFAPERVVVFFLDEASALRGYATDPEYVALAPIRDRGLRAYDFFLGKVPS